MRPEAQAWWQTAEIDLQTAEANFKAGAFYIAAFLSQQAAEKAFKALFIVIEREPPPRTHNLRGFATRLQAPADIVSAATRLAPAYTVSRYPDAASGPPTEAIDRSMAEESLEDAKRVVQWVSKQIEQA